MTCGDLEALDLIERRDYLVAEFRSRLDAALIHSVEIAGQSIPADQVATNSLAYAIGFNLTNTLDKLPKYIVQFQKPFPEQFPLLSPAPADSDPKEQARKLWRQRPVSDFLDRLRLGDLAVSVAMEQREDWNDPHSPPKNIKASQCLFWTMCERVTGTAKRALNCRFGHNSKFSIDDCMHTTWVSAHDTYWSDDAKSRFGGLDTLKGILISIAINRAYKQIKDGDELLLNDCEIPGPLPQPTSVEKDEETREEERLKRLADSHLAGQIRQILEREILEPGEEFRDYFTEAEKPRTTPGVLGELLRRNNEMLYFEITLESELSDSTKGLKESAELYHIEGATVSEISERLGFAKSHISRLLDRSWVRMGRSKVLLDALHRIERGIPPHDGSGRSPMNTDDPKDPNQGLSPERKPRPDQDDRRDRPQAILPKVRDALEILTAIREGNFPIEAVSDEARAEWAELLGLDQIDFLLAADEPDGESRSDDKSLDDLMVEIREGEHTPEAILQKFNLILPDEIDTEELEILTHLVNRSGQPPEDVIRWCGSPLPKLPMAGGASELNFSEGIPIHASRISGMRHLSWRFAERNGVDRQLVCVTDPTLVTQGIVTHADGHIQVNGPSFPYGGWHLFALASGGHIGLARADDLFALSRLSESQRREISAGERLMDLLRSGLLWEAWAAALSAGSDQSQLECLAFMAWTEAAPLINEVRRDLTAVLNNAHPGLRATLNSVPGRLDGLKQSLIESWF
jgi:hypothetical protein